MPQAKWQLPSRLTTTRTAPHCTISSCPPNQPRQLPDPSPSDTRGHIRIERFLESWIPLARRGWNRIASPFTIITPLGVWMCPRGNSLFLQEVRNPPCALRTLPGLRHNDAGFPCGPPAKYGSLHPCPLKRPWLTLSCRRITLLLSIMIIRLTGCPLSWTGVPGGRRRRRSTGGNPWPGTVSRPLAIDARKGWRPFRLATPLVSCCFPPRVTARPAPLPASVDPRRDRQLVPPAAAADESP